MSRYLLGFGARLPWASIALVALALCLVGGPSSAAPYTVIDLATLDEGATVVVRGVNGGGTAVGGGRVGGARRGLLFTQGGLQAVDGLDGSDYSVVFDINELGAVVGGSNGPAAARAFLRTRGGEARELAPLPGDTASTAFGRFSNSPVRKSRHSASAIEANTRAAWLRAPALSLTAD